MNKTTMNRHHSKCSLRGMLVAAPVAGACAACALAALPAGASADVGPHLGVPVLGSANSSAELQEVEQKLASATATTEHITGHVVFSGRLPQKLAALDAAGISFSGEASGSPPAGEVHITAGGRSETVLVEDEAVYLRDARLAAKDGGKPWVKVTRAEVQQLISANPTLKGSGLEPNTAHPYAGLAKLLGETVDARSFGTSTLDGQTVTVVGGALPAAKVAEEVFSRKLAAGLRDFHIALPGVYRVYVNSEGIPLRSEITLLLPARVQLSFETEITAVNTPVDITAPLASETISATEAAKIEKEQATK